MISNTGGVEPQRTYLRPKRTHPLAFPFKMAWILFGVFGVVFGLLLCCTIVGILVGLPMMWGGMGVVYAALNRQPVACPHCGFKRNYVRNRALNFVCRKCRNLTLVDWQK